MLSTSLPDSWARDDREEEDDGEEENNREEEGIKDDDKTMTVMWTTTWLGMLSIFLASYRVVSLCISFYDSYNINDEDDNDKEGDNVINDEDCDTPGDLAERDAPDDLGQLYGCPAEGHPVLAQSSGEENNSCAGWEIHFVQVGKAKVC